MELENHGLDSVQTRRDIAIALGLSPLALGVGSKSDTKTHKLYSTTIIRTTLELHREAFYTTGNFGIPAVNKMVGEIAGIIKEEGGKRDILEVYAEYTTLGILIGKEELNQVATEAYIKKSIDTARSLKNPILLVRALGASSNAMYRFGNLSQAEKYALEADSIQKIPHHLKALTHTDLALVTNDMKEIEKAQTLVMRDNDFPQINLDLGYCCMYGALVLLNAGKYDAAETYLTAAEEQTSQRFARRHCIIQTLQAQYYLATKEYDNAAHVANTALTLANDTKSKPNIRRIRGIINQIKTKK